MCNLFCGLDDSMAEIAQVAMLERREKMARKAEMVVKDNENQVPKKMGQGRAW